MFSKPQFTAKEIAELHSCYQNAVYEVYYDDRIIQLFIERHNPQLDLILKQHSVTSWAFITAFNPYSQCLSAEENQQRHQLLIKLVRSQKLAFFDGVGKDKDGAWTPEPSIFIIGIKLEKAISIGNKFQQNAIVFGELKQASRLLWLE